MHSYVSDAGMGVFGPLGDVFGFDDLGQTDPLTEANAADVEAATRRVAQFDVLYALAQGIQDSSTRQGAMDIVNKQWYKVGTLSFLGLGGKYNLVQLAQIVKDYAALPNQQFVYFNPDFTVNRTREDRLNSFVEGMRAFESYMSKIISLPGAAAVNASDTSAASLLRLAQGKAAAARLSGNPSDAAIAQAVADSAVSAAKAQGNTTIQYQAQAISDEMAKLAGGKGKTAGGPIAPLGAGMDTTTILMIGGGVAALVGLIYFMTRD